jgi:hypothetical protein
VLGFYFYSAGPTLFVAFTMTTLGAFEPVRPHE